MPADPGTLSSDQLAHFRDMGFLVVRQAFSPQDAGEMERRWWAELEEVHQIRQGERATWRRILSDLKKAKHDPIQERILTASVRGILDDLLGAGDWLAPRDWGRAIATFPGDGNWDVPASGWHWDNPCAWHAHKLNGLFVVSFIGSVKARAGGTLVLSGSPRLLMRWEARLPPRDRAGHAAHREAFLRSHPWLMALSGKAQSPANRIRAFMDRETIVDGVALRVVELTGEPGDMVFCHPCIVHVAAPNCGQWPRFMRIKHQLMTAEGQAFLKAG